MADEKKVKNNKQNAQEPDLNQIRKVRREKFANLQAEGKDPFVITKYDGLDPEISNESYKGVDKSFYPRPRTYMLGLNLQF